jgi:hypothetical protein
MDLPIYCVLEGRPVKVVESDHGGVEVWLFDLKRGDFIRRGDLLERVLLQDDGVTELNEDEFEDTLRRLRQKDARQAG